jgi:hypothetical protein
MLGVMEKKPATLRINENNRSRLSFIGAGAAALSLFLAGCSLVAENGPSDKDKTVNCTENPNDSVSTIVNTLDADTINIGDIQDANGEPAWRNKNTIDVAGDGDFSVTADGFGPVTNYANVLKSNQYSGNQKPSLSNSETGGVLLLRAEASSDLSKYAPVTFTYTC